MPEPSTLCVVRARFAWWATSPSEVSTARVAAISSVSGRLSDGSRVGRPRVTAMSAARIDRTASRAASFSTAAIGILARMARYRGTLLTTVPPRDWMRARTVGVTSARMSTVTRSSAATLAGACRPAALDIDGCPRDVRLASRSCELTFRWTGVRCAFASSSASICRTAFTANPPLGRADVCCAWRDPTSSGIATIAPATLNTG